MGVQHVISKIRTTAMAENKPGFLAFDCSSLFDCDFTVAEGLVELQRECIERDLKLIFYNVQVNIQKTLLNSGMPREAFQSDLTEEFCGLLSS